ncbi:MAG: 1-acyl-sn-glycerol-3-phosphate acyltransferase [Thermoleophilia bacterium]|nr:1-acyl-sn-glycerol-3-phosphate acyltransferase [Thermoleophilia bacterium]
MRIDHLTPQDWAHHDPSSFQRLCRRLVGRPGRWLYRYRGYGHWPRVPEEGGFFLAPGPHGAYMDPFIFGLGQARTRLRFMAKYEALEWPIAGRFVRWGGGFPVHRGGGRSAAALEVARTVVDSGDGLVLFMEGRMSLDDEGLREPRDGLAILALLTGAPVVPVAAYGAKRARAYGRRWWNHRPCVTAVWGAPISFSRDAGPSRERIAAVRDEIWAEVTRCFEQARRIHHRPGGRPAVGTSLAEALDERE